MPERTPSEIAASLNDDQCWLVRATRKGMRGLMRGLSNYFDTAGYGAGVAASARALRRQGILGPFGPSVSLIEVSLTPMGLLVAAELTRGKL